MKIKRRGCDHACMHRGSAAGKFEKGMKVKVARTGRVVTLAAPQRMFANERVTVQDGFAGVLLLLLSPPPLPPQQRAGQRQGNSSREKI